MVKLCFAIILGFFLSVNPSVAFSQWSDKSETNFNPVPGVSTTLAASVVQMITMESGHANSQLIIGYGSALSNPAVLGLHIAAKGGLYLFAMTRSSLEECKNILIFISLINNIAIFHGIVLITGMVQPATIGFIAGAATTFLMEKQDWFKKECKIVSTQNFR